jgi:hypothetical protein
MSTLREVWRKFVDKTDSNEVFQLSSNGGWNKYVDYIMGLLREENTLHLIVFVNLPNKHENGEYIIFLYNPANRPLTKVASV